ncbi:PRC-barrel domain-containing protein [Allorhodopirellula solitaria]|uniref:PRC-barrel domain protein n=1 Tax=Allorhodopirellula solitaria TaxID=2527987 RepID=A0A5C5YKE5_9BACT|nr:PRC-barrel domain-containing protein [Allorhodopirellula solitaria]TWT75383.1 PRC-barrel domain protein [Allorhodopirellula solitaria]
MNRTFQSAVATVAIACLTIGTVSAQDSTTRDRNNRQRGDADAGRLDEVTRGANIRVSQLIGYNIQNSQGESVGEIQDIVMNSRTGRVSYVAVTYGGFLGVGNKLFAVPFAALKVQVDPDEVGDDDIDEDDYTLVLDVTQEQLDGQQGFDEDNWPDMADRQWRADLDKRYGVERRMNARDRQQRQNRQRNSDQ